jgi:hypothetical protein
VTPLHFAAAGAATAFTTITALIALPLFTTALAPPPCASVAAAPDGTPPLLSPSVLRSAELVAWWAGTGRGQPSALAAPIDDVIRAYLTEAADEGVRGDLAFVQALLETGYFTSADTANNNFAGIAHYDNAASGRAFPDAATGIRAHIQLLHKFAAGNHSALAHPDVAPDAGATATTWGALAGTWATDPAYWTRINALHQSITTTLPTNHPDATTAAATGCGPTAGALVAGDYALPVERRWYDEHPDWFTKPHHDHPAADIPVPTGTPIYATTNGTITAITAGGDCGTGIFLTGTDGAQYVYCHGLPNSTTTATGDTVSVGQQLMASASTGNSTGPHLHFAIRINGQERCPQNYLVAIAQGQPLDPHQLPATGCTN